VIGEGEEEYQTIRGSGFVGARWMESGDKSGEEKRG
jgi:hypothetical protein